MAIKVVIRHNTNYRFDRQVAVYPHIVRLRPAPHCRTRVEDYSLDVIPTRHFINWQQDPFGNYLARFVFPEKTEELSFNVEVTAELTVINPFDFFLEEDFELFPFTYDEQLKRDLGPYLEIREQGKLLTGRVGKIDRGRKPVVDFLVELNVSLQKEIDYLIRMDPGVQSCEETLTNGSGSCRDSAWLLVQVLRHLGLAARFVSGYLVQLTADMKSLDGPSGPENDFTDLHAWAEVFLPGAGWVGMDPTSGMFASEGHIPLACTPDPQSAAPVTGSTGPCEAEFSYSNSVFRIHEDPRVTRPYTEEQWKKIKSLGEKVDRQLKKADVRLTMGGEPTFVSIDDMEGAQWNTEALGEEKRKLAGRLLQLLQGKFATGAVVQNAQGKWYPGEPLPRWALSLYWRSDGKKIWHNAHLRAADDKDYGHGTRQAKAFMEELAGELAIGCERIVPGYEDTAYYAWKEGRLPVNVTPEDNKLNDPLERQRIRELLSSDLGPLCGYALPVKWQETGNDSGYWKSSPWPFRDHYMFLIPGNSPMGLRLPLDSLPWQMPDEMEIDTEADHFADKESLPEVREHRRRPGSDREDEDNKVIHTAVCIEPRQGRLHVFLPPLKRTENFIEFIHIIETVADRLGLPVVIEGYEPPRDPRLQLLQITPDPGVIEVNIHPAGNWRELVKNTEILFQLARKCRLGTEKFMLDGRHSGTGGGNHVTLGGVTPADSPFLRRPHLLRSLILYWQNHPGLSYLFSSLFIGPTSQAPRVDEARDDSLYELEIAMALLPEGDCDQPWLVDRILRNFLVDLTGNTHRAEFCIDKLYSPDGPSGRRGLVEFRAFEMPPHARMSLVQMLLLRCLVARFWQTPYRGRFIRWGTELHDRFMLRHYVWQDLKEVIADLNTSGYDFKTEWFAPFVEFRFPHIGTFHGAGMQVDVHTALEPWHVLGEASSQQGTARYVDSSVERLQVSVQGMTGSRYIVTCNGRRLPLRCTGSRGSYIAGVRFKAWQQHSSLHPTIKVHTPLIFDIVDTKNCCSVAASTYHVSHPGGRNYDTFPVNAGEAEARRNSRFEAHGGTQGKMSIPAEEPHPDQPFTLDLRIPPAD